VAEDGSSTERTVPACFDLIIFLGSGKPNLWRLLCHQNLLVATTGIAVSIRIASRSTNFNRLPVKDRERRHVKIFHRDHAGACGATLCIFVPHAMTIRELAVCLDLKLVALNRLSTIAGRWGPVNLLRAALTADSEDGAARRFGDIDHKDRRFSEATALVGCLYPAFVLLDCGSNGHSVEVHSWTCDHLRVSNSITVVTVKLFILILCAESDIKSDFRFVRSSGCSWRRRVGFLLFDALALL